jgi:phosphoenolpyruvate carboxykinase (diphosphate)
VLGQDFHAERSRSIKKNEFEEAMRLLGDRVERKPEGYAVDRRYPNIFYVPESAEFHLGAAR